MALQETKAECLLVSRSAASRIGWSFHSSCWKTCFQKSLISLSVMKPVMDRANCTTNRRVPETAIWQQDEWPAHLEAPSSLNRSQNLMRQKGRHVHEFHIVFFANLTGSVGGYVPKKLRDVSCDLSGNFEHQRVGL